MQTLIDLLNSVDGRQFLEQKRIFVTQEDFIEQLAPPASPLLAEHLGLANELLILNS